MKSTETIYGLHPVRVLLERHPERIVAVRLTERRDDPRVREIEELARKHGRQVQRVDAHALKQALGDVAHQGVVAEIAPLPPWSEDDLMDALQTAKNPLLLALDGVQDPHNLGACLRTADACGALAVVVPRDRAAWVQLHTAGTRAPTAVHLETLSHDGTRWVDAEGRPRVFTATTDAQ